MYSSPIELIYKDAQYRMEKDIFYAIQKVDINVNKDELIKALAYDRNQYEKGYADALAEQKKGRWQITDAYPHNVYCSECHMIFAQTHWAVWEDGSLPRNFCPNCGAEMEP